MCSNLMSFIGSHYIFDDWISRVRHSLGIAMPCVHPLLDVVSSSFEGGKPA